MTSRDPRQGERWNLPCDPLLALRAGDPAPFEQFVRTHARTLVAFFRQRGACTSRAEDLAQDVFLKLYSSAERYRPKERFSAYCFRLALNAWIDDRRARVHFDEASNPARATVSAAELAGPHSDPGAGLALEEEGRRLRVLLAEISPAHRAVFELAILGELSYREVAELLSIPVGTVKSRMFHALRGLRGAWEGRRQREGVA